MRANRKSYGETPKANRFLPTFLVLIGALIAVGSFATSVALLVPARQPTVVTYVCPSGYAYETAGGSGLLSAVKHMCVSPNGETAVVATRTRVVVGE